MLLVILMEKKSLERVTKNNCKKQIKKSLEEVIKRKDDKVYVKWKGYDNFFNSWILEMAEYFHSINSIDNEYFRKT